MFYATSYHKNFKVDYTKKINILIAVSGETRCFNELTHSHLKFFKEKLESLNNNVFVIGHTWKHCPPIDKQHYSLFDALDIVDQKIIDDWVLEDFLTRCPNNDINSFNITQPNKRVDIKNKESIDIALKLARYSWGQHWSAFASFKKYNKKTFKSRHSPPFDILIRWRWDNSISLDNYTGYVGSDFKLTEGICQLFFNYLNTRIRMINFPDDRPIGITDGASTIATKKAGENFLPIEFGAPILNDRFIIFNNQAAKILQDTDFPETLELLYKWSDRKQSFEGHTLWYTILLNLGINMNIDLPIFVNLMRSKT